MKKREEVEKITEEPKVMSDLEFISWLSEFCAANLGNRFKSVIENMYASTREGLISKEQYLEIEKVFEIYGLTRVKKLQ